MPAGLNITVTNDIPPTSYLAQLAGVTGSQAIRSAFPKTVAAIQIASFKVLEVWRQATAGVQLPGMPKAIWSRGDYTKSINASTPSDDPLTQMVSSEGPWTEQIEKGHGEIDLKPGLLLGPKAREGKNGPYNIVSFRHGTPNTLPSAKPMPVDVYKIIQKATKAADAAHAATGHGPPGTSKVLSVGTDPQTGRTVRTYEWGYKLPASHGGVPETKHTSVGDYTWKTGKYTSMYKFKAGAGDSNQYRTFRTVSVFSDPASWIVPPLEGNPIRQAVVDAVRPDIEEILRRAIEEDLS